MARNQKQIPPYQEGRETGGINRAMQMRRDNDTVKIPEITPYDVDYAIIHHLTENMKLQVIENDRRVDVPVIYANSEMFAQIRTRGYLRDLDGKMIAPIIAIRRTGMQPNESVALPSMNNYTPQFKRYPYRNFNMQYDRIAGQNRRKESLEYYLVDAFDYVTIDYELILYTNMIEQMNRLVQAIMSKSNHMWGDFFTFRTVVNNESTNNTNNVGEDRVVSSNISLTVDGYLREAFEYHEPTVMKAFTTKTVRFDTEQEQFEFYIEEPSFYNRNNHISQEPKHLQRMKKRRNIRYR